MIKSDSHSGSHSGSRVHLGLLALAALVVVALLGTACGSDSEEPAESGQSSGALPTVVVTTSIMGDVVSNLLGDAATVETLMPTGSDPHEFQASAKEVDSVMQADVLVINGADFEEGLVDTIEAAESEGVPVCEAIATVETIDVGDEDHSEGKADAGEEGHTDEAGHSDEEGHADEAGHSEEEADHADGDGEHAHEHSGVDPHFFTDPARMAVAAQGVTDCIVEAVPALDTDAVRASADGYIAELEELDAEVESIVAAVPAGDRVLVTNHEVFGYFADRYGFEVAGAILPGSTQSEADAAVLAELAELIEAEGVPVVFADTSAPNQLADALAAEAGEVQVVELFSESLGPDGGATYIEMVRTNAQRIADALA